VSTPTILDIGTGTGCIAITLALEIPASEVYGIDISDDALTIAQQNAQNLKAKVHFSKWDILSDEVLNQKFDIIVSNPPYITEAEKRAMKSNVLDFEPHLALFVTDEDPLIFYRAIAKKGRSLLKPGGKVHVEINEQFGSNVSDLFRLEGYSDIQIKKDLDTKDRIVTATLAA
jgi:release factor glutamine methyltransferase